MNSDPAKKVKVTICPPAEQEVFFQEQQFDTDIREGVDPIRWWQGNIPDQKTQKASSYGLTIQKNRLKKAEKELEGHEHKNEIMKILRSGLND